LNINKIYKKLILFKGAKRRFNEKKVLDNIIIDDYAHHPNEIEAVINAARQKYPSKELIAVFEPHTYSRTKQFGKQIAEKLNLCDYVYVMDIYPSREKQENFIDVKSNIIINKLQNGEEIDTSKIEKLLKHHDSMILFMSPNDLSGFQKEYIKLYEQKFDKNKKK